MICMQVFGWNTLELDESDGSPRVLLLKLLELDEILSLCDDRLVVVGLLPSLVELR